MALVQTLPTEEMTERRLLTCKEEFAKLINTNQPLAKFLIGISNFGVVRINESGVGLK